MKDRTEYLRKWRAEHRDHLREYRRKWRKTPGRIEYLRKWNEAHPSYHQEYRKTHPEDRNEYHRLWRSKNRAASALYKQTHREKRREQSRNWALANRHKRLVHKKVYHAIQTGKLTRQPCQVCGKPKTHGHHADYTKPLEVTWLCPLHHTELHYGLSPLPTASLKQR